MNSKNIGSGLMYIYDNYVYEPSKLGSSYARNSVSQRSWQTLELWYVTLFSCLLTCVVVYLFIQVHVVYQRCSQSIQASCNCAVAIQSGDDVFVVDRWVILITVIMKKVYIEWKMQIICHEDEICTILSSGFII